VLTVGSLFSGIGGLELGLERAGLGPVLWQVERDPYCRQVLEKHWPETMRHEDVNAVGPANLEPVQLICGGFPCQDVSSAGARKGLAGDRSGLWYQFDRVVRELAPEWVIVENVASGATLWLDAVVCDLEQSGYACLPIPLSAFDVGAPHLRRRIFVVGHADSNREPIVPEHDETSGLPSVGHSVREGLARASGAELRGKPRREEPTAGGWWETEPALGRVANGVPNRVDRLRALGNAVVPQCAEVIGWAVRELGGS
jgi:DNA (cytosine-5)-methyltransferase 1